MAPALDPEGVRNSLRYDAVNLIVGALLTAVAIAAAALSRLRQRELASTLQWFGLFAFLYGIRLLADTGSLRFAAGFGSRSTWLYLISFITYTICIPGILFVRELLPRWRTLLNWLSWFQVLFAVAGIAADLTLRRPSALNSVNNLLVVSLLIVFTVGLLRPSQWTETWRVLRITFLFFALTVLLSNLSGLGLAPLPFNPEPIGFAVFLAGLGYVIALRTLADQQRLLALDGELAIARRIQNSLLPRSLPQTEWVKLAASYQPMTAVAGDLYDFLVLDAQHFGVFIADVSGHGVPAALIASMVKVTLASQSAHAANPGHVLAGVNNALCGNLEEQYVTAAYLYLDLAEGRFRYAAAGHPPMLRMGVDQGPAEVIENGLVLGMMPGIAYSVVDGLVRAGDRFLLYTDGLTEAANANRELFGEAKLASSLAAQRTKSASAAAAEILRAIEQWSGQRQDNDRTLVVVDIEGLARNRPLSSSRDADETPPPAFSC